MSQKAFMLVCSKARFVAKRAFAVSENGPLTFIYNLFTQQLSLLLQNQESRLLSKPDLIVFNT
jgi:hypothetical protein